MPQLTWFITGCSSGFGEQFVHSILARGDNVIATARKIDKLEHIKQAGASILQLDITSSPTTINETVAQAISIHGKVDVLLNNAGYVAAGGFEDLKHEDFQSQFDTNVFGTVKMTQALLPHFRQRKAGTIVFIGSQSGWIGEPGISAYAGSKFALEGMSSSNSSSILPFTNLLLFGRYRRVLQQETSHLGIRTLLIEPGRFRTNLLSAGNIKAFSSSIPDYADFSKTLIKAFGEADQNQPGDPSKLVDVVVDLVKGEGVAGGKELPLRLPLGSDCYGLVKGKCEEMLGILEQWEEVIKSTDIE